METRDGVVQLTNPTHNNGIASSIMLTIVTFLWITMKMMKVMKVMKMMTLKMRRKVLNMDSMEEELKFHKMEKVTKMEITKVKMETTKMEKETTKMEKVKVKNKAPAQTNMIMPIVKMKSALLNSTIKVGNALNIHGPQTAKDQTAMQTSGKSTVAM